MKIYIEEECEVKFDFDYSHIVKECIKTVMEVEQFPFEAEVNVIFVPADTMQAINKEYRNMDKPTDVLSFPLIEYAFAGDFAGIEKESMNYHPETKDILLGDMIICVPKVKEQALEYGHSEKRELAFLTIHSMLHLFGYDHMEDEDAKTMEKKQKEILNEMNIMR